MLAKSSVEFIFFLITWIFANVYSLFRLYEALQPFRLHDIEGIVPGWSFLNRSKDDSDFEWSVWKNFTYNYYPWLTLNILASELCRVIVPEFVPLSYLIISLSFFFYEFSWLGLAILIIQPILYFSVAVRHCNTFFVWLCCLLSFSYIYSMNYLYGLHPYNGLLEQFSNENIYIIMITSSWIQLRCISFCYYHIKNTLKAVNSVKPLKKISLIECLSYCLYLPLAQLGPFILYEDFEKSLRPENHKNLKTRLRVFITKIARSLIWFFFVEFALHFIYFNRLHSAIQVLDKLDSWPLYGGGLWMGLFFYMKYLIFYGIGGAFSSLDHIEPLPLPQCIMTVHLYSDMWKNFDVGLYRFLVSFIYKPSINTLKELKIPRNIAKALGSLLCFAFVYIWHGTQTFILVWTILNYLGVIMEDLGTKLFHTDIISKIVGKFLKTDSMKARFNALVSSPLLLMSALSNFYFFGGLEFGNYYVVRVFSESVYTIFFIFLFLYSSCFVSAKLSSLRNKEKELSKTM